MNGIPTCCGFVKREVGPLVLWWPFSLESMVDLASEQQRNEALKATLAGLKSSAGASKAPVQSDAQKKAAMKMKIIDKEKDVFQLKQKIEKNNLQAAHLAQETKNLQSKLRDVQTEIDQMRSEGVPVWESVGINTVPYKDPFHTGLSKRTPTGATWSRTAPRVPASARPPPLQCAAHACISTRGARRRLLYLMSATRLSPHLHAAKLSASLFRAGIPVLSLLHTLPIRRHEGRESSKPRRTPTGRRLGVLVDSGLGSLSLQLYRGQDSQRTVRRAKSGLAHQVGTLACMVALRVLRVA